MEPPLTEAEIAELREVLRERRRHAGTEVRNSHLALGPRLLERDIGALARSIVERHEGALRSKANDRGDAK